MEKATGHSKLEGKAMAEGTTAFTAACFRDDRSRDDLELLRKLIDKPGLSEEQCTDLKEFVDDVCSDLMISNDLVDLAGHIVGGLNVCDGHRQEQSGACSALLGVQLQLQAVARRLDAISDKLRAAS
jgi:hypothetical protein